jgi:tRNA (guanine-N7-)-methyltransferase
MKKNREIKSYVLRSSRMTPLQKKAYKTLYVIYGIKYSEKILDFSKFFNIKDIIIEIGFGMGEATIEIAKNNLNKGYIAIDVHKPGIGKLLSEIKEKELINLKVIEYDAIKVFDKMIPDQSLSGVHIFFPDPWPKKRHHKRRLINKENIELITNKLKTNGYIYICTDWENYAEQILDVISNIDFLKNKYSLFAPKQKWRPKTKFEIKGINKSHKIWEVFFEKR